MPGKSKHGKRKQFRSSKKSKSLLRQDTVKTPVPAAAGAPTPSSPAPADKTAKVASPVKAKIEQYAYVPGDLRRIGALSGIVIVILFVLYYFLA